MKTILTSIAASALLAPSLLAGSYQSNNNISQYDTVLRPNFSVEISTANAFFEGPESEPVSYVLTPVTILELLGAPEGSRMWWVTMGPSQPSLVVADSFGDIIHTVGVWTPTSVFFQQGQQFFSPDVPVLFEEGTRGIGLTLNMAMYWTVGDIEVLTMMRQGTTIRFGRSSGYVRMRSQAFLGDGAEGDLLFQSNEIVPKDEPLEDAQLYMVTKGSFSFSGRIDDTL